jgi:nucleotide-binding universal stress UspA family protein
MTAARSSGPRIVVGASYSESGTAALRWAIDQARLMGAAVEAVRAFTVPPGTPWSHTRLTAGESIRGQIAESERAGLENRISQLGNEVQITPVVREGRPVDVLTQAAWGSSGASPPARPATPSWYVPRAR